MKERRSEIIHIVSRFGKSIILIVICGLGVHLSVMLIDLFIVRKPLYLNLENEFIDSAFSYAMIPVIMAYLVFSLLVYLLWQKMRQAVVAARETELRHEKQKMMLDTLQKIVAILGEHITAHNSEIQMWIADVKMKKKQPPRDIENASRKIAAALGALSEIAFLSGQTGTWLAGNNTIRDMKDIEVLLKNKIRDADEASAAAETVRIAGRSH